MRSRWLFLALLGLAFNGTALARTNLPEGIRAAVNDGDFQIGDEWGKEPVTLDTMQDESAVYQRVALATAHFGRATAFYLGKFNGHYLMATNYHVLPTADLCDKYTARFPMLDKEFECEKFYGSWKTIDLAIFSIVVDSTADDAALAAVGHNFNFHAVIYPGEKLLTMGFGFWRNPASQLMANEDDDCKVFSDKDEFHYMSDPDRINPAIYKAWSFAIGCDVSHGDSGSAIVDRETGDVLGLLWTTATNKDPKIRDEAYLDQVLRQQLPDVWSELTYAVPAPKIKDYLDRDLQDYGSMVNDPDVLVTLRALLSE